MAITERKQGLDKKNLEKGLYAASFHKSLSFCRPNKNLAFYNKTFLAFTCAGLNITAKEGRGQYTIYLGNGSRFDFLVHFNLHVRFLRTKATHRHSIHVTQVCQHPRSVSVRSQVGRVLEGSAILVQIAEPVSCKCKCEDRYEDSNYINTKKVS